MFEYKVSVATGHHQLFAGTINSIYVTLVGTERSSDKTLLDKSFFDRFGEELLQEYTFDIHVKEDLGDIIQVKLESERYVCNYQWYCRCIKVNTPFGICLEFPCYQWITDEKEVVLRRGTALLPQDETDFCKDQRCAELESRQKTFRWSCLPSVFPMSIDADSTNLPQDVQFETDKTVSFKQNVCMAIENRSLNKFLSMFQSWEDIADFQKIYLIFRKTERDWTDHVMEDWKTDKMFGYQFLNGCNPVMIKKCENIPGNFPVTQEMVNGFLERGLTLQEELKAGNIYIADYEILEGVPANTKDSKTHQYLAAPICLLYKNTFNHIVPIAIQLSQTPGEESPIFLPNDDQYDWMLAKMWVKSSDFNVHQIVTHLLRTHLITEVFAIAMFRTLSSVHPVYKLLTPHVHYTIAINTLAREELIGDDGIFDKACSIDSNGIKQVVQKAMGRLTYKSMWFPEDIKARGMDSQEDIPNYYYRDDGLKVWDAVKRFVSDVVEVYYKNDENVKKDDEIQAFVLEVSSQGLKNCGDHDFPKTLESREQLTQYLTVIIFTASAQHAAVNFGQFDWYAWIPNSPSTMRKEPPRKKGQVNMKYIMDSLPDRHRSCWILGTVWILTQLQKNELFLGMYPDNHFTEQPVKNALETFRKNLGEVTKFINNRNDELKLPYKYLSPDRIPNSVSI
ncbi:polyunsaturated fatty acid 5-lipoxygenase-like [Ctenopharyngodon idella]|uniref:polyunsaturated fatty acid 5-lipoxygenase-like n=1 Tax=Ctenopharyngodon idella TaxID=7959 RepID=UPI00222E8456|nr:polyunsaturated fatty acid 5-lipoxygenase-like [Ctenopharyngodon idella]